MAQTWDAIVIGSGIGGMTAATLLAKVGKMRVLVLEKHSERGGFSHVFRRDGASWDVGVHYVGDLEKGSRLRVLFDYISGGALQWNRMTEEFERFIYPGLNFPVPSDPRRYQARLVEHFPDEAVAIRRYFEDLHEVEKWFTLANVENSLPAPLDIIPGLWRRRGDAKATQTTAEYLNQHFKSTELKGLLASQWADYGLPPSESAFALHAVVIQSFAKGGWFPDGGSSRIARTFEAGVEAYGGVVKVCHEVTSILTSKDGRVTGVRAVDLSGAKPTEVVFHAPIVISNAGAQITYNRLLPTDGEVGQRTAAVRKLIEKLDGGISAVTLYLRLKKPVSSIGLKGENHWINTTFEHGDRDSITADVLAGNPRHVYMSFPSSKSGDGRFHTAEVISLVNGDAFSAWQGTERGARGKEYMELKDRITEGLLKMAETAAPGFRALIQYSELSTPLSVEYYTSHRHGAIYGLKGTPDRYRSNALTAMHVPGLHLTGSDAMVLGVAGAFMGGVITAGRVLGPLGIVRIMKAAGKHAKAPRPGPKAPLRSPCKKRAVLAAKTALTPSIWQVEFELDEPVEYAPGQYAMLLVAPFEWRYYSIAAVAGKRLTLLISTRTGGDGSGFADKAEPGVETEIELPFGSFQLRKSEPRRVFIATGTGLAPFLPMFAAMEAAGQLGSAELLFGCRRADENITRALLSPLPPTTACVSGDPSAEGVFHGRVTRALEGLTFDPATTSFYLCGAPAMVDDCQRYLVGAGATQIRTEVY